MADIPFKSLLGAASLWVSGKTYAKGDCAMDPNTLRFYARKVAGAGTTAPAGDTTNWVDPFANPGGGSGSTTGTVKKITQFNISGPWGGSTLSYGPFAAVDITKTTLTVTGAITNGSAYCSPMVYFNVPTQLSFNSVLPGNVTSSQISVYMTEYN